MKNCPLEKETLKIRGKELTVFRPASLEPFLEGEASQVSRFPFWAKLWEAAIVLADFVATLEPPRKILEIGAGLGVPGLTAAAFGHEVTLTDYEDTPLELARRSAEANGLSVRVARLDWLNPHDLGEFEVIVGAEVVYAGRLFQPLLDIFRRYLLPGGEIYLAHDRERARVLVPFLKRAEHEYEVATSLRRLRTENETFEIVLNRLRPKGF
ncbi:methyltransferase [Thermosulfurimonas sp. F29]|uniref:class I SAM-dependent methyltransferase n=1 Tax=Thermosulfurimonas sp. F29 TaxID=2867247 RepID=UPI001C82A9F7|nr:methyltransferase domain-containing protein [Thermosulfurimonas sp. F29]MBX6423858.1 methyltransferase domain-containing protein [Thermosulfurimonas sp. F29]